MTSNQLARPPAPQTNRHPYESPRVSNQHSVGIGNLPLNVKIENAQIDTTSDDVEDRPPKRRKVDNSEDGTSRNDQDHQKSLDIPEASTSSPNLALVKDYGLIIEGWMGSAQDQRHYNNTDDEPPAIPPRPASFRTLAPTSGEYISSRRLRNVSAVPNVPDIHEKPGITSETKQRKPPGYFPWTGKNPEDVLSDVHVKQGYFDRPPNPPDKELNTARLPLYDTLKQQSGIDGLSNLFSMLLERKGKHGLLSSTTSFKPPSRVTFTEAKRKSWISDLANPEVSLRKLCRTIPQGIRGQLLLDQCLLNNVPMSRAIWFAKCVGALDMRLLKRKGIAPSVALGAENKWLGEWTINVEQFLESILSESNDSSWRSKIEYALRLSARLYLENLLDRDHFLDWIVQSFAASAMDQLPFWLIMIHSHDRDLLAVYKRGKRLVRSLINKLAPFKISENRLVMPIINKIRAIVRHIAYRRPACWVVPDQWPEYREILLSCLNTDVADDNRLFDDLRRMNERCMGENKVEQLSETKPEDNIISLLDSTAASDSIPELGESLISASADTSLTIRLCLEWATTSFRCSHSRLYLICRLFRRWHRLGHDIDSVLFGYLSDVRRSKAMVNENSLRHLVAELSRSRVFPANKYLQWLIARGLPRKNSFASTSDAVNHDAGEGQATKARISQECNDPSKVLLDVCFFHLDEHVINLRNSILETAGFDPNAERALIEDLVRRIDQGLSQLSSSVDQQNFETPDFGVNFSNLSWTVRFSLSRWLRSRILSVVKLRLAARNEKPMHRNLDALNLSQFLYIRYVLEILEDEAVLADVLDILTTSVQEDLLASIVDTIHRHSEAFAILGALGILQEKIGQAYMALRNLRPSMPTLAMALLELCSAFPSRAISLKLLQQDIVKGDRGRLVAACSPFSDGIAESLQQAGATFIEDFEAILQSEPNMNEQTLSGLFNLLTERIEKQLSDHNQEHGLISLCQLLARLKLCRKAQAETLIKRWLAAAISQADESVGQTLIISLLATGCISCESVSETILQDLSKSKSSSSSMAKLKRLLDFQKQSYSDKPETYVAATKWSNFVRHKPESALHLMVDAGLGAEEIGADQQLMTCLALQASNLDTLPEQARASINVGLTDIFGFGDEPSDESSTVKALRSTDVFSYPFVRLGLRTLSHDVKSNGYMDSDSTTKQISSELINLMSRNKGFAPGISISKLLLAVGPEVATMVRRKTEEDFLELLPKSIPVKTPNSSSPTHDEIQKISSALSRTFHTCVSTNSPSSRFIAQLGDRLGQYSRFLGGSVQSGLQSSLAGVEVATSPTSAIPSSSPSVPSTQSHGSESGTRLLPSTTLEHLDCLLQMICLQRPAFKPDNLRSMGWTQIQMQQEQVKILESLALIAGHPVMVSPHLAFTSAEDRAKASQLRNFICDVISTLVDDLPDDSKVLQAKSFREKMKDDKLKWLFGNINSMGSNQTRDMGQGLMMFKDGKGIIGEWKPKVWEVLENGSSLESESCLGMGLFNARR